MRKGDGSLIPALFTYICCCGNRMCTHCIYVIYCLSHIDCKGTSTHDDTEWQSKDRSLGMDSLKQTTVQFMCKEHWLEL